MNERHRYTSRADFTKTVGNLLYGKSIVKGGEGSCSVAVNADSRRAIDERVNGRRMILNVPQMEHLHKAHTSALKTATRRPQLSTPITTDGKVSENKGGRTLPKHNQSKALGSLTDFSGNPSAPKVDPLETRVTNLERAVNEILFQLADISERLDQPIRNPESGQGTSQKPPKPQKSQPPEPEEDMTDAEVAALADRVFELLSDGTPRSKKAILKALKCQPYQYLKARLHLIDTGRMPTGNLNEMIPGQICNVPGGLAIWTQDQIAAELARRKARDEARETEATDADAP